MKILFIHQNFPGQYLPLARYLGSRPGNEVVFITQRAEGELPGVRKVIYKPKRQVAPSVHHYLRETEAGVLNGQEVARAALGLRNSGFTPEVILGHNGWGEIWYLKEIFPHARLIGYFEFFYRLAGADVGFEPDVAVDFDAGPRVRTKNVGNLLGLDAADLGQCPTQWQRSLYPARYHPMLEVVHEGVDTRSVAPNAAASLRIPGTEIGVAAGDEVVTYVARNLEPYRGFPSFMRSLPEILRRRPAARILIVGGDEVSYGARPRNKVPYREQLLKELDGSLDSSRVHFLGRVPYQVYLNVLQVSRVHVYLTFPFVLSWSMLEAMSCGCLLVASRTAPVQEVIRHGENGLLVDMFNLSDIAGQVVAGLETKDSFAALRMRARQTILDQYDLLSICLPAQLRLIRQVMEPPSSSLWRGLG